MSIRNFEAFSLLFTTCRIPAGFLLLCWTCCIGTVVTCALTIANSFSASLLPGVLSSTGGDVLDICAIGITGTTAVLGLTGCAIGITVTIGVMLGVAVLAEAWGDVVGVIISGAASIGSSLTMLSSSWLVIWAVCCRMFSVLDAEVDGFAANVWFSELAQRF